jgi:hypothetical protein
MKNKFVYIWGALFIIAIGVMIYTIYKGTNKKDHLIVPCRFSISAVVDAVNEDLIDITITSKDCSIKEGTKLTARIPENFIRKNLTLFPGSNIEIYYFDYDKYVEGEIWEPDDIIKKVN